ncbi:MAG: sigma-70 family RNA polymerase sigma factor [Clostridia bacterium]|nr:sigma-70 family RNA polymerase sigma factor [Clostridia bacterium]
MEDSKIIDLFWQRDERAIAEIKKKYGNYCYTISHRILKSAEDAEECLNDTYLRAWNTMPPKYPQVLSGYLAMIIRNLSIDKYRKKASFTRGAGQTEIPLSEIEMCIPAQMSIDDEMDAQTLAKIISAFLREINDADRDIFVYRYWYLASVKEISEKYGFSQSKVKTSLHRTRNKLRQRLEKEGVFV